MEIGFTTDSAATVKYDTSLPKRTPNALRGVECDTIRTSSQALLLSRSLPLLKEQLLARDEIVQQFADSLDTPVELDSSLLDRMIDQL